MDSDRTAFTDFVLLSILLLSSFGSRVCNGNKNYFIHLCVIMVSVRSRVRVSLGTSWHGISRQSIIQLDAAAQTD